MRLLYKNYKYQQVAFGYITLYVDGGHPTLQLGQTNYHCTGEYEDETFLNKQKNKSKS